jgi:hypothetical protein
MAATARCIVANAVAVGFALFSGSAHADDTLEPSRGRPAACRPWVVHPSTKIPPWPMGDGCGWRSPPPSPFSPTTWTLTASPGWTLASSIPMRWLLSRLGYWSRAGRSAPRTTSTVRISRSGRPRQHGERRSRGSAAPAAGGVIGRGCAGWRRGIAAASTTPTIKLPSRSSPSRSGRGRDLGGRRPQGHHRAGRGSGAELAVAAVAPHPPSASIARQGRAGRHRRAAGGRAGHLLHLPCLSPAGPQAPAAASFAAQPVWGADACRAPSGRHPAGAA